MNPSLVFSENQRLSLQEALKGSPCSPYSDYKGFSSSISNLIASGKVPDFFQKFCETIALERKCGKRYVHYMRNCPIDDEVPYFDQNDSVNDKYVQKKTFVGESFLEMLSQLTHTPLLAYDTRNNGDFFHDVYAHNKYSGTQTQKTDGELFFHNDRTAHVVRADYLCLLGMRSHEENRIYTGYIDGRDLLNHLDGCMIDLLRTPYFVTPFDDYSQDSNKNQTVSEKHFILENEHDFRYYDTRTTVASDSPECAKEALLALKDAILKSAKVRVQIRVGDLFCFPNQGGLHNRDLVEIADASEARRRWLLKTYSFKDPERRDRFRSYFHAHLPGLVCDEALAKAM